MIFATELALSGRERALMADLAYRTFCAVLAVLTVVVVPADVVLPADDVVPTDLDALTANVMPADGPTGSAVAPAAPPKPSPKANAAAKPTFDNRTERHIAKPYPSS
jgi:hypothetical protein